MLFDAPEGPAKGTLVLAHGAGANMETPFMARIAAGCVARGIAVARFEFTYMAARRDGGKKRPPPRADKLIGEFSEALDGALARSDLPDGPVLIGGKSMGGRVAAMLAGTEGLPDRVKGVACLGYPFHPLGKPDEWRLAPLEEARLPVLIAQGERDTFGTRAEIEALALPAHCRIVWLSDGNHDLAPRGKAEATWTGNLAETAEAISGFLEELGQG